MLPVLPEGGGAEAGRVSVERLTAVTDRSATGISEASQFRPSVALPTTRSDTQSSERHGFSLVGKESSKDMTDRQLTPAAHRQTQYGVFTCVRVGGHGVWFPPTKRFRLVRRSASV